MENSIKMYAPKNLRPNNVCDLVKRHIADRDIPENHGTVKDTGNGRKGGDDSAVNSLEGCLVCHVASRMRTVSNRNPRTSLRCLYIPTEYFNICAVAFMVFHPGWVNPGISAGQNQVPDSPADHPVAE